MGAVPKLRPPLGAGGKPLNARRHSRAHPRRCCRVTPPSFPRKRESGRLQSSPPPEIKRESPSANSLPDSPPSFPRKRESIRLQPSSPPETKYKSPPADPPLPSWARARARVTLASAASRARRRLPATRPRPAARATVSAPPPHPARRASGWRLGPRPLLCRAAPVCRASPP